MTDIDILELLFRELYNNGVCYEIQKEVSDKYTLGLTKEECHRIRRAAVATGMVRELNYAYGSHPALELTAEGTRVMLDGGYKAKQKKKDSENKQDKRLNSSKMWYNYSVYIIPIITFILGSLLSAPIQNLLKHFLERF